VRIFNKKARYNYTIIEKIEAGVVLTGSDVKGIHQGKVNLTNSYAKIIKDEVYLVNADIAGNTSSRKLLLHKKETISLLSKIKTKRLTLIPTKLYTTGRLVKVEIALAKPKKQKDKKAELKKIDINREIEKELKRN